MQVGLNTRIELDLRVRLDAQAKREDRPLSKVVAEAIEQYLNTKKESEMSKVLNFPADRIAKGVHSYTPEMGQRKPNCQMRVTLGHYGTHYYIDTPLELKKARGIKLRKQYKSSDLTGPGQYMVGWYSYEVTCLAYDRLKEQYSISRESLLD